MKGYKREILKIDAIFNREPVELLKKRTDMLY